MPLKARPLKDRMWRHIEKKDGHWLWTGFTHNGYGRVLAGAGTKLAHRAIYELLVGPIPDGLQLDHLCRVKNCVNPAHLEPVTPRENIRRHHALTTHCPHGHELTAENVYLAKRPDGRTSRKCRTCVRQRNRAYKARVRLQAAAAGLH